MGATPEVVVVGAGLAGLACARRLLEYGRVPLVVEAADGVGGRVRTDVVDGFRLDRGFQVLLDAYPEARRVLDYAALDLRPFHAGAMVRVGGRFHRVADPWRHPVDALLGLAGPVGTLMDKLRIGSMRQDVAWTPLDVLMARPETTTEAMLRARGFSDAIIDRFFRPFLGGILLDRELQASSRMAEFVLRMLALGRTVVPARGMGEIPAQLAALLPAHAIRLGTPVRAVHADGVVLDDGTTLAARAVVVACDGPAAATLLPDLPAPGSRGVTCVYFAAPAPPVREPLLVLDGEGTGPVLHCCVPSSVSPACAARGQALVSATVLGIPAEDDATLAAAVRAQLGGWFGDAVAHWRLLRVYRIPHAQPAQDPPALAEVERPVRQGGVFVCGDHRDTASIHGAMLSGRRAADAVAERLTQAA